MFKVVLKVDSRESVSGINCKTANTSCLELIATQKIKVPVSKDGKPSKTVKLPFTFEGHFGKFESVGILFLPKELNQEKLSLAKDTTFVQGNERPELRFINKSSNAVEIMPGEKLGYLKLFTKPCYVLMQQKQDFGIRSVQIAIEVKDFEGFEYDFASTEWVKPQDSVAGGNE